MITLLLGNVFVLSWDCSKSTLAYDHRPSVCCLASAQFFITYFCRSSLSKQLICPGVLIYSLSLSLFFFYLSLDSACMEERSSLGSARGMSIWMHVQSWRLVPLCCHSTHSQSSSALSWWQMHRSPYGGDNLFIFQTTRHRYGDMLTVGMPQVYWLSCAVISINYIPTVHPELQVVRKTTLQGIN